MGDQHNRYRSWASKLTVILGFAVILSMAVTPLRALIMNTRETGNVQGYVSLGNTQPGSPDRTVPGVATIPSQPGATTPNNTTTVSPDGAYGVSSSNRIAADVAMEVMAQGGNAADAAAAAALVLSVVEPHASGLGGAGGALVYTPQDQKVTQIMYRERSSKDPDNLRKKTGVPGLAKGLEYLIATFGSVGDEKVLIEPARQLAANGFKMDSTLFNIWKRYGFSNVLDKRANDLFFPQGIMQTFVVQPDYAETLKYLQDNGLGAFYKEPFASELAAEINGLETEDLTGYTIYVDEAVRGTFEGWDIFTASPPMSGVTFVQMLNMMEQVQLQNYSVDSTEYYHFISDITNLAYRSRFLELADPTVDYIDTQALASKEYSQRLASQIQPGVMTILDQNEFVPDQDSLINPEAPGSTTTPAGTTGMAEPIDTYVPKEESHTTHLVVVDKTGMMVSMTNTIGTFFGTGKFPKGFFMNNLLTNFNDYDENPGYWGVDKSPRSFTTPSIMIKDGKVLGLGSPGGARIPAMLAQGVANFVYYDLPLSDAMERYRIFADKEVIKTERSLNATVTKDLNQMGYSIRVNDDSVYFGGIQALLFDPVTKTVDGAADSRRGGVWRTSTEPVE